MRPLCFLVYPCYRCAGVAIIIGKGQVAARMGCRRKRSSCVCEIENENAAE